MKKPDCLLATASCFLAALSVLAVPGYSEDAEHFGEGQFAVVGVRIFDGENTLDRGTVLVEDGEVTAVGPEVAVPTGWATVDGSGATLLPGLIDSHTHTWGGGLERAVIFGVTTHLDMFTDIDFARSQREEQAAGQAADRADLFSAGILATAPGGHGTQFGMPIPTLTTPGEAEAFVEARRAEGSDYLKIVSEDGSGFGREIPTLDRETIAALIEAAASRKMMAVVHVSVLARATSAIEDGADGLVHLFSDQAATEEFIQLMVEQEAFVVPTLTVVESTAGVASGASLVEDEHLAPYLTPEERSNLNQAFPNGKGDFSFTLSAVGDLHSAGVPILAGSDAPNPSTGYGSSLHRELELLVAAGLSPSAALAAATSVPADIFALADRGRIAPGLKADLVLVGGDPTVDIKASRNILWVWKDGQPVDRPQPGAAPLAPTPEVPESGLVSDFSGVEISSTFGAGWAPSTDELMGGVSSAELVLVPAGTSDDQALEVRGTVAAGFAFPWGGALFYPGTSPMASSNLSAYDAFTVRVRSESDAPGGSFRVMVFAESLGMRPAEKRFSAGPEWTELRYRFSDFGVDGSDLSGILLGAGPTEGDFALQIDDLRLVTVD